MKFIFPIILFICTVGTSACKKETLHWQKIVHLESHTTSRLNRITFINNNTCIVGGGEKFEKSEILVSYDGGDTWDLNSFPKTGKGMYGLAMSPSGSIYLSGFDGRVIMSEDEGATWKEKQVPDWRYYVAIAYPTNDVGFYIATEASRLGTITCVDNDYKILDTTGYDFGLNDIVFPAKETGYISGFGAILKTSDGGNTWALQDIKNDNFMSLHCLNENEVWTCGYNGSVYHTTDGGLNWKRLRNGNKIDQPRYHLADIVFKDKLHGWAVGEKGLVIYTADGGETWEKYSTFTDAALLSIAATPDGNLLVSGEKGVLYKLYL